MKVSQGNWNYADITFSLITELLGDLHVIKHMRIIGECIMQGSVERLSKRATTVQYIEHNSDGKEDNP